MTESKSQFRYCPRVESTFPIVFAGDHFIGEGTVLNMSVPGCAVRSKVSVRAGDYLELRVIVLEEGVPLRIHLARVRWSQGKTFGVEFIRMPGSDQVRLGRMVKKHAHTSLPSPQQPRQAVLSPDCRMLLS